MKSYKFLIFLFTSIILSASTLNAKQKVAISTNGLGDFLIAPMYIAKDDVCTKIKIFNTNEKSSVLAKVVFREQISAKEVNLPIALSPGDVWDATICEVAGKVYLTSTDDSNHSFVKEVLRTGKDLNQHSFDAGYNDVDFRKGYVEVYPIAQFDELSIKKVDKSILFKRWDILATGDITHPFLRKLKKTGVDENSLGGSVLFQVDKKTTASINMSAFKNTHSKQVVGQPLVYSQKANPSELLDKNSKKEILELLQSKKVSFAYENYGYDQYLNFAFPFGYKTKQTRSLEVVIRDRSENKSIAETIIFSPKPTTRKYSIKNELSIIPVRELVELSGDTSKFKEGMIQIKEITNMTNVQLGKNKTSSLIPTYMTTLKDIKEDIVNTIVQIPAQ